MKSYKLSNSQAQELTGVSFDGEQLFNPIEDANGNFIISSIEVDNCTNKNCMFVKDLELIDSTPKTMPIIPQ